MLDTTFFIDLRHGDRGAESFWQRVEEGHVTASFSTVVPFELWTGGEFNADVEAFFLRAFQLLDEVQLTRTAAMQAGAWLRLLSRQARNIRFRDALIAASALERNEPVYTRNTRDFLRFPGVRVETY